MNGTKTPSGTNFEHPVSSNASRHWIESVHVGMRSECGSPGESIMAVLDPSG